MQAAALMPGGNVGQAVGRLEGELFEQFHVVHSVTIAGPGAGRPENGCIVYHHRAVGPASGSSDFQPQGPVFEIELSIGWAMRNGALSSLLSRGFSSVPTAPALASHKASVWSVVLCDRSCGESALICRNVLRMAQGLPP